jgi:signal transduction histidine kinase
MRPSLTPPVVSGGIHQALQVESTLQELPLYNFYAELTDLGTDVAQVFEQHPLLPGVIVIEHDRFVGMISRQRLLEYLLRPHGIDLFLREPLQVLLSYARVTPLILAGDTSILVASQQALRRSPDLLSEPIIVQLDSGRYQLLDIRELIVASWQLRGIETQVRYERMQLRILQGEKMASLGRLVDGVAHEILDPVSFIWGNLSHVSDYTRNVLELLVAYEKALPQAPQSITDLREDIEIDYIREDLPKTLESIKTGAERLSKLAGSLQNFCHLDEIYPKPADLHDCLDGVLLLLKSRLSSEIEIVKHYGNLPPVPCFISQLSQVFMNIFSRAIEGMLIDTINEQLSAELYHSSQPVQPATDAKRPRISVTTEVCSIDSTGVRWVSIRIADNSQGTLEPELEKLVDALSNSPQPLMESNLLGSYQIVTLKHKGKLKVRPLMDPDKSAVMGTEFEILLPMV